MIPERNSNADRVVQLQNPEFRFIDGNMEGKHIVSIDQFTRDDMYRIFQRTRLIKELMQRDPRVLLEICKSKVMASFFAEPSTRTYPPVGN